MKNKIVQLAFGAVLVAGFAASAFAQNPVWHLNSDHSTGRLSLSSTADPNSTFDIGIARVKGTANLTAGALANSTFDFAIYPADQDPVLLNEDGSLKASEFSNVARSTVINFRAKQAQLSGDGKLAVTGDLTVTHLERPAIITYSEAYSGPVYGEPEVRSSTREVTFVFDNADSAAAKAEKGRKLKLAATADIKAEDFPGLLDAVTDLTWPVVVEDEDCQTPATIGEDYHGASCTGTPVVIASLPSVSQRVGEDYPGPDTFTPRTTDNVKIALNLELTRGASAVASAAGN